MTGRMYYFFSVGGETGRGRSCPHVFFYTNLALSGAGAVLVLGTLIAARQTIFGSGFDAEFAGWAWDMLGVYYRLSLIPLAVFLGVSALSCVVAAADPKQRSGFPLKLRLSAALVFSLVLLFLAPLYSFMTVNEKVALDIYILLTGFGEALILRAPLLIEYGRRMREKSRNP